LNNTAKIDLKIESFSDSFAGEIKNINLSNELSIEEVSQIKQAFDDFGVIIFRHQKLTPTEFSNFSKHFGKLHIHHLAEKTFPDNPEVRVLSNVKKKGKYIGQYRAGHYWHTDLVFLKNVGYATLLHGIECPPTGADTLFSDMREAFTQMPDNLKSKIIGKSALHDHSFSYEKLYPDRPQLTEKQKLSAPPVRHPLISIHPRTGHESVYMTSATIREIDGFDESTSREIVGALENFCTQNKFIYEHKWKKGDVIVWDNLRCLHSATSFDEKYDRILYRTQTLYESSITGVRSG
tara:strand:+ start:587 stop:1465 length:879 start_codon:yes stop_codon:yes gene_type:complete